MCGSIFRNGYPGLLAVTIQELESITTPFYSGT
jgi:hypothetical protein